MDEHWKGKHYSFTQNTQCEYFPCHKTAHPENFNCLFCYCPLYALGDKCGGNFKYSKKGYKDCTDCKIPHVKDNFGLIIGKFQEIAELTRKDLKSCDSEITKES